jgi:predicted nucleic acid-binding protein
MVVLDASTAILLAKVELLDAFLRDVGQTVIMPKQVQEECCGRDSLDARLIMRSIAEKRITVKTVERRGAFPQLVGDFGLGRGEAAAIALALFRKSLVATDDKRAINACKVLKIPFTTAISVLTRMYEKGLIQRHEALEKLEALAVYGRYKNEIIAAARVDLEK